MSHFIDTDIRFSIVPEWILDANVSDRAIRLYSILARYADNETLQAFPSRETLAKRAHCNAKAVTKAIDELVTIGAVTKQHRKQGDSYQSNLYTLRRVGPIQTPPRVNPDTGVGSDLTPPRVPDDSLTRTTELEPENYIEQKQSKARRVPSDWQPTEAFRTECEQKFPTLIIANEVEAFVDYHTANGSVFKDFNAAFRTWCRNAVKWSKPKTVVHKQEVKPAAEIPEARAWVRAEHDRGEHYECRPGEFGCK